MLDGCGVCGGDDGTCSGCTDDTAFNYDCLTGNFPQGGGGCGDAVIIDNGSCIYTPEEFSFNQSTQQAFYFIVSANLEGSELDMYSDWVGVFKNDICVGSYPWTGAYTTVPAMGDDGSSWTSGYMGVGDSPKFKIFDGSEGQAYNAEISATGDVTWKANEFLTIDVLSGFSTIAYSMDLHYGANLKSFPALPEDNSVDNIMLPINDIAQGVIGEGIAANNVPGLGSVSYKHLSLPTRCSL